MFVVRRVESSPERRDDVDADMLRQACIAILIDVTHGTAEQILTTPVENAASVFLGKSGHLCAEILACNQLLMLLS